MALLWSYPLDAYCTTKGGLSMKDCIAYENGCCKAEEARWGFPYKCINEDYKDNKNHCVEYEKKEE